MIKQKAKDHSVYVKHISHNHLIKAQHAPRPMSDWKKVVVFMVVVLILAIICLGLYCES